MSANQKSSFTSTAVLLAVSVLVVAAGGTGYAAGRIGTADIRNGAVTAPKIRAGAVTGRQVLNGSLTAAELVVEEPYHYVGRAGQPDFASLGSDDCTWQPGSVVVPGVSGPGFRRDRFGTIRLTGVAVRSDDLACESSATPEDAIVFRLPPAYRPVATQLLGPRATAGVIVGSEGLEVAPGVVFPPGAVALSTATDESLLALDGVTFEPVGSPVVR